MSQVNEAAKIRRSGFGCPSNPSPGFADVSKYLEQGAVRLALAKAKGVPLAPFMINVRATFPDTATSVVPDVGGDVILVQDTVIDQMVVRIFNRSLTANQNQFQAESDWFFNWQSGIEATLDVQGAPRYTVAQKFTPLANLMDAFNGSSLFPRGWILGGGQQQQLFMSFSATVTLPVAPVEVVCTWRAWAPVSMEFTKMSAREALGQLQTDFGFEFSDAYIAQATLYG